MLNEIGGRTTKRQHLPVLFHTFLTSILGRLLNDFSVDICPTQAIRRKHFWQVGNVATSIAVVINKVLILGDDLLVSSLSVLRNGLTAAAPVKMHSRLQELKKEEETLLKIKVMLQDQLNRLKVCESVRIYVCGTCALYMMGLPCVSVWRRGLEIHH